MDDPRYGTEPPENIPVITESGILGRVLAGQVGDKLGPFKTVTDVQMVDYVLESNVSLTHLVPEILDNCLVYAYKGSGTVCGVPLPTHHIVRLDATNHDMRQVAIDASSSGLSIMLFAGKMLREPIAWRGPFVMNTDREIQQTIRDYQSGRFPPKRVPWDYKKMSAFPRK
jgi:hypothetical protein